MKNKLLFFIFNFTLCILNFEITQGANYYWVNGTGNWSNYAVHWATTSGGNIFHVQVPTSFDNVYFDANSFTAPGQIVTADPTILYCLDMDWTGATYNPVFEAANTSIQLKIYGSLTLNTAVNYTFNGQLLFTSFNPGKTIQTFSQVLHCPIEFNGAGGEWSLLDSLTTTQGITLTYGTLRTNNHNIRCYSFYSNGNSARALYLGLSTVSVLGYGGAPYSWNVSSSLVLDADSSLIRIHDTGYFYSEGTHNYNIVQWDSTNATPFYYNYMSGNNYRINKIIGLNSNSAIWFNDNTNIRVDSIIDRGMLWIFQMGGMNYFNYIWVNRSATINQQLPDTIIKMVVNEGLNFSGSANHFVHDLTVGGSLSIYIGTSAHTNSQTFDSCRVYGDATILSGSNHLGIFTMTPGKTLTLKNDSTQYIDSLSATGQPGFPIQIVSSDLGITANVFIQEDLCTNYLYIHAVHATSPNSLYVGVNSNDVANNSGWIFSNCIVGIEDIDDEAMSLYPNPATTELRIKNAELKIEKVEIYDALGNSVFSQQPAASRQELIVNVSSLYPGIYFVKIKGEDCERISKFVKH